MSIALKRFEEREPLEKYPMYISNPIVKEGIKNYVTYALLGTEISNSPTCRFSDFYTLREKLLERWPGLYIPNIPPKKAVGNVDTKTIVYRMRLINVFCYKISNIKYIFTGDELKIFRSQNSDASKALEKMVPITYREMLEKYQVAFPDFREEYDLILGKGKIIEFQSFIKRSILNLKNLNNVITETLALTELENTNSLTLLKHFEEHEKETLLEYAEKDESKLVFFNPRSRDLCDKMQKLRTNLNNPYQPLHEWIEEEELDLEAMLQAVDSFFALNDTYDKTSQKSDQIETEIKNLQSGQKSIKGFFSFKSKDSSIADLEKTKKETEDNITYLHSILKICCFTMDNQIESFKEEKMKKYYSYLRLFADMQKENNNLLGELFDCIGQNQNIKSLVA